ncbi:MAG: hypothetical protein AMJ42_03010 [Deltaproteobacteria bacterium DG_8]|nr:MAG: hypothetical protein AMJ42_03010 [Deltaproteobacteria bacterium DG_8]
MRKWLYLLIRLTINNILAYKAKSILTIAKKEGVIEMKTLCLITLILCLFLGAPSCKKAQEEPTPAMEEKVEEESQAPMIEEEEIMVEEGE